jgi:O-antigen ligase
VLFCLAVGDYPFYAARDLAIFSYSLFYPLVYFAIRERRDAIRLLQYFTYAGVIAAALLVLQETIGLDLGLFDVSKRVALGQTFVSVRSGNENVFSIFSLVSLSAYVVLESRRRAFNTACAILCFLTLTASDGRASVVGVAFAVGISLYCAGRRERIGFLLASALVALPVALAPIIPPNIPASRQLEGLRLSVISAAGGPSVDTNAKFRTLRWQSAISLWSEYPFLGAGFGREIIPSSLVDGAERRGEFNVGMPHNTFLFVGARTGLVGLSLFLYCWCSIVMRLAARFRCTYHVEDLAVANILAAMFGFAMFGLFIERPGTDASFWILLAIGTRLAGLSAVSRK